MIAASAWFSGLSTILDGVEMSVRQRGYSLAIVRTHPDEGYEIQPAVAQLMSQGIEGHALSNLWIITICVHMRRKASPAEY